MHTRGRTIALGIGLGWALVVWVFYTRSGTPVDAACYYDFRATDPWNQDGCFLYSPPVAQAMLAIRTLVPFEAFAAILRAIELGLLAVIAGPALGLSLLIPAVAIEINAANVNIIIVALALIGFRYPWVWAFPILTKLTPGVCLLWFAARREWRHLAIASVATIAIIGISLLTAPDLWVLYVAGLKSEPNDGIFQIWWRLPLAAIVVVWGARGNHRWALIVALFLSMPRWYYLSPVVLVGLFTLVRLPRPLLMPWRSVIEGRVRSGRPQTAGSTATARAPSS